MRSSNVAFGSSIIAHSSPRISTPCDCEQRGVDLRAGRCRAPRGPSDSASRRAGSIVTTATRLPDAARPSASAADAVVLPTPPEPATMQTRLPSRRSATPLTRDRGPHVELRRQLVGEALEVRAARVQRQPRGLLLAELAQARELRALAQRALVAAQRPRDRGVRGVRLAAAPPRVVEAVGVQRVGDDALDRQAHALAQRRRAARRSR